MKTVLFAVFAHPDDEAFGPCGTLLREAAQGTEVHLLTATLGEAGTNPDNHPDLAAVREQEWRAAGKLIGAHSMHYLGFHDSQLTNASMVSIGQAVVEYMQKRFETLPSDVRVELLTNDTNGITGHIDHIVAARAAAWAFYRLKESDERLHRIRFACLPYHSSPAINTDWLYMEPGRQPGEIDEVVDNRQYRDKIIAIMRAHHTQRRDGEQHIAQRGDQLGIDYFMVGM